MRAADDPRTIARLCRGRGGFAAVEAGAGISAVSELAARRSGLPMVDLDLPHRRYTVLRHSERTPNRAQQALIDLLVADFG